jgi:CelD/BcsL family acetyltransferase involved in cellulose biosynthesis
MTGELPFPAAAWSAGRLDRGLETCALDDERWLAFLSTRPEATAFHQPAWSQLLADVYGYRSRVLALFEPGGEVAAGLPLLEVRSRLTGHRLVTLPFTDHCPVLARAKADLGRLAASLVEWREAVAAPALIIHAALPEAPGVRLTDVGVRHVLSLNGGRDVVLSSLKGGRAIGGARKAEREGVRVVVGSTHEDLEEFYRLHVQTRRRLGVPTQPRRFFKALWERILSHGHGFTVTALYQGRAIAATVLLASAGSLVYKYSASDAAYWRLRPNNLIVWTAIELALERGCSYFDFGRSGYADAGLRDFKSRWGAAEEPLVYSRLGAGRAQAGGRLGTVLGTVIRRSPPALGQAIGELLYGHTA